MDSLQRQMQPTGRYDTMSDDALEQMWQQFPGSAPGGTGETGLGSFDADGWSSLQSRNAKYMNDRGARHGVGRNFGGMPPSIADDPTSPFNTNPDGPGNPGSIGALQRQMDQPTYGGGFAPTMRQQADDLYKKKYPGLSANSNKNIVWGS